MYGKFKIPLLQFSLENVENMKQYDGWMIYILQILHWSIRLLTIGEDWGRSKWNLDQIGLVAWRVSTFFAFSQYLLMGYFRLDRGKWLPRRVKAPAGARKNIHPVGATLYGCNTDVTV